MRGNVSNLPGMTDAARFRPILVSTWMLGGVEAIKLKRAHRVKGMFATIWVIVRPPRGESGMRCSIDRAPFRDAKGLRFNWRTPCRPSRPRASRSR